MIQVENCLIKDDIKSICSYYKNDDTKMKVEEEENLVLQLSDQLMKARNIISFLLSDNTKI